MTKKHLIITSGLLLSGLILIGNTMTGKPPASNAETATAIPVETSLATTRSFSKTVNVQGTIEAETTSKVAPKLPGTLESIFVDEGDAVTAGETVLFLTDPVKREQAVRMQEQNLAVSRCALREKEAAQERVMVELEKTRLDYRRYEELFKKRAISQDQYEQQQSATKQMEASRKHAQSLVDLSKGQVSQSETALAIARQDLADTRIVAPITGVVSHKYQEEGESGSPGRPVLRVEALAPLEAVAWLPAEMYPSVIRGETLVTLSISGKPVGSWPVSFKSPTIDETLRSFKIKCIMNTPPEAAVPGAMANMTLLIKERSGVGVPRASLQIRKGKSLIFVLADNRAHPMEVRRGMESGGFVELLSGAPSQGTPVITRGASFVEEGTLVAVQEGMK
ncbi:efflux RND transporter periplasmic adaptor subunit [Desulfoluna sp.]|uniref:efflux RND transporter periplasmic adaptor subunit n=1 Tax=Desulfoluna sp. TaxID=2045199 RepID=UPI002601EED4|nr:efflux RND transporter periplasmic adaptor subunit [Desulfoluna sp.]